VTVVRGHGLQHEGRPVLVLNCCGMEDTHLKRNLYDQVGHGLCACGVVSGHRDTTAARQQWHRLHKADVLERT